MLYQVLSREFSSSPVKVVYTGVYAEAVRVAEKLFNEEKPYKVEVINENGILMIGYDNKNSFPIKWLSDLKTGVDYVPSGLCDLVNSLLEGGRRICTKYSDNHGERVLSSNELLDIKGNPIPDTSNDVDDILDAVILALPEGIADNAHSITVHIYNSESINLWSRKLPNGETQLWACHKLGDIKGNPIPDTSNDVDGILDAVILALPEGVADNAHNITVNMYNSEGINSWSRKLPDGETEFIKK